eukprot:jgi/Ulvmu1/2545/UM139_0013.1
MPSALINQGHAHARAARGARAFPVPSVHHISLSILSYNVGKTSKNLRMTGRGESWLSHPLLSRHADSRPRAERSGSEQVLLSSACITSLHIAMGTIIWMHLLGPRAAFGDAFYFAVVTFLTIGYGDITPASSTSKVFFIIYTVASLIVQLTVVSNVLAKTLDWRPPDVLKSNCDSRDVAIRTFFRVRPRIIRAAQGLVLLILIVGAGAVMLHMLAVHDRKDIQWIDCWYWSVTTISTVGFGDIVPHTYRPAFALFFLVSVVLFAYVLGESVALVTEVGKYRRLEEFFAGGLSPKMLDDMDTFRDGQVSKVEFMMFILERLDLVDREELERVLDVFTAADVNGDGVLNLADIQARCGRAVRAPPGSALADARSADDVEAGGTVGPETEDSAIAGGGAGVDTQGCAHGVDRERGGAGEAGGLGSQDV